MTTSRGLERLEKVFELYTKMTAGVNGGAKTGAKPVGRIKNKTERIL
jgi:hypothetical protein